MPAIKSRSKKGILVSHPSLISPDRILVLQDGYLVGIISVEFYSGMQTGYRIGSYKCSDHIWREPKPRLDPVANLDQAMTDIERMMTENVGRELVRPTNHFRPLGEPVMVK